MNIVITGASRGIGKALAEQYAAGGHTLFLCSRGETGLYAAMESLLQQFPQATIKGMPADVSERSSAQKFASWVLEYAVPDVLINNAGNFIPGSINNEAEGVLEQMMISNLYSAYHVTRTFLPAMMEKRSGYIFNMCSIASIKAYGNGGAYSISKHALLGFSRNLREELKPYNIKVSAVMPGAAYTASWEGAGVDPSRLMEAADIAVMIEAASRLSPQACVEEIILRPQLGDL